MKQYVHPILKNLIVEFDYNDGGGNDLYNVIDHSDGVSYVIFLMEEWKLKKLGFIEKEEEPDTDTKWIDDAYNKYESLQVNAGPGVYSLRDKFKKAILSHLPSNTK